MPPLFLVRATGLDLHFAPQREQNKGSPPSSRRRQQSTGLLQRMGSSPVFPQTKRKRGAMPLFFFWCGRQDSNLHAFAEEPKSTESTNSTTPAYSFEPLLFTRGGTRGGAFRLIRIYKKQARLFFTFQTSNCAWLP